MTLISVAMARLGVLPPALSLEHLQPLPGTSSTPASRHCAAFFTFTDYYSLTNNFLSSFFIFYFNPSSLSSSSLASLRPVRSGDRLANQTSFFLACCLPPLFLYSSPLPTSFHPRCSWQIQGRGWALSLGMARNPHRQ